MRVRVFEFNDSPACPAFIRDSIVETLGLGLRWGRIYEGVGPVFAEFCARARVDAVLDLCSGSGEPASIFVEAMERAGVTPPRFVLSDLFPNVASMQRVAARHPGRVDLAAEPVDATRVPPRLDQPARAVISAFHHFAPDLARGILADCVAGRRAVFIVEPLAGDARSLLSIVPVMTLAVLANPLHAARDRVKKALLTWALPVIPALGLWDAVVSDLRIYRERELRALVEPLGGGYVWEYREVPFFPGGRATCFFGIPPA